jgi:hypothetical protein
MGSKGKLSFLHTWIDHSLICSNSLLIYPIWLNTGEQFDKSRSAMEAHHTIITPCEHSASFGDYSFFIRMAPLVIFMQQ